MNKKIVECEQAQSDLQQLRMCLEQWDQPSNELLDILDVLGQVDKKLGTAKNPEALINRLVNYVRSMAIKGRIHFADEEERLMISLSVYGQKAGLNGLYMADFSDKSQFYSLLEEIPRH